MKRTHHFLAFLILCSTFITSCSFNCLPGEGAIVTQEVDLDIITGIDLETSADVEIRYGKNQFVEVTGHENHIALLSREVSGNTWHINFKENVCTSDLKVKIMLPNLETIKIDGSGDVRSSSPLKADNLELEIKGSGQMNLQVSAAAIELLIDGSGDVTLQGNTQYLEAELDGSGNLNAQEIEAEDAEISIDGSGDATVDVSDNLDVSIRGSGSIKYAGNPKIKSTIKGSGEVIKD